MPLIGCINYKAQERWHVELEKQIGSTLFVFEHESEILQREHATVDCWLFHYPPPWDLNALDYMRRLKQRFPSIPIIVTSTDFSVPVMLSLIREARPWDFALLPSELFLLKEKIKTAMRLRAKNRETRLVEYVTNGANTRLPLADKKRVTDEARTYIDEHFQLSISREDAAKICRIPVKTFSRAFKFEQGITFQAYLTTRRIIEAKRMLLETELSILEVALECGYEHVSLFNRIFKLYTRITPKEYRKNKTAA